MSLYSQEEVEKAGVKVWRDKDEWGPYVSAHALSPLLISNALQGNYKIGDPILHIELRRWADIVLIAPCSANSLSKIANGLCDNLAVSDD